VMEECFQSKDEETPIGYDIIKKEQEKCYDLKKVFSSIKKVYYKESTFGKFKLYV